MTALGVGDYAIGRTVVVERKRVDDLHGSVIRGRFWAQIGRLRVSVLDPYLLVEGPDLDDGPLSPQAVRGCLVTAADLGVRLLRSTDAADSALWLHRLAIRHGERPPRRDRPLFTQRPRSAPAPAEAVLAAVPGISHRSRPRCSSASGRCAPSSTPARSSGPRSRALALSGRKRSPTHSSRSTYAFTTSAIPRCGDGPRRRTEGIAHGYEEARRQLPVSMALRSAQRILDRGQGERLAVELPGVARVLRRLGAAEARRLNGST